MPEKYEKIADVPTDLLASNVVGTLILAKGNLNKYKDLIAYLIRELRGEPHPQAIPTGVYWSREAGNFYDDRTNKGMGVVFYEQWKNRKDEFPEKATSAAGLDIHLSGTVIPSRAEFQCADQTG